MAKFLATNGISYITEGILMSAMQSLTLVLPTLSLTPDFLDRLTEATQRGVQIKMLFGKNQLTPEQQIHLAALEGLEIYHQQDLYACCCFNEQLMVLSSMNASDYMKKSQRHMGMLIDREQDHSLYKEVLQETYALFYTASRIKLAAGADMNEAVLPQPLSN